MAVFDNMSEKLRTVFDEGLDEVLIFAIIFILILLSENNDNNMGILPVVIIGLFLLVFVGTCRTDEAAA